MENILCITLVGGLEHFLFSHILGIIIPNWVIFFRGVGFNHQPVTMIFRLKPPISSGFPLSPAIFISPQPDFSTKKHRGATGERPVVGCRDAMFTPLMASVGGYAATAYFYNLGRFKFDAEQRQDCIYQIQNMRLVSRQKKDLKLWLTCWGPHFNLKSCNE